MMTCHEFDQRVTAYLAGTLPEPSAREFESHAASCAACEARLDALTRIPRLAQAIALPGALRAITLGAVRARRASSRRRPWMLTGAAAACAAIVLLASQPARKRAQDVAGGASIRYAAERAKPELEALNVAAAEVEAALRVNPDDQALRAFMGTIEERRTAITRQIREAAS